MGSAQDPASLNRFLYAVANPTTFTDPSGHRVCEAYCEESAPRASETKHERAVGARAGKQRERRNHQREFQDSKKAGGASNQKTIWIPPSLKTWLNWSDEWRSWYFGNYLAEAEGWSAWGQDDARVIVYWVLSRGNPRLALPSTFMLFDDATIGRLGDAVDAGPRTGDTALEAVTFRSGGESEMWALIVSASGSQIVGGAAAFRNSGIDLPPDLVNASPKGLARYLSGDSAGPSPDTGTSRFYAPTASGRVPSWSTVRSRYWKSVAKETTFGGEWDDANLERMRRGLAPQRYNHDKGGIESIELSHEPIPRRYGGTDFVPRWPQDHAAVDPFRRPGY